MFGIPVRVRSVESLSGWLDDREPGRAKVLLIGHEALGLIDIVCGSEEIVWFVASPYHGTGVEATR